MDEQQKAALKSMLLTITHDFKIHDIQNKINISVVVLHQMELRKLQMWFQTAKQKVGIRTAGVKLFFC